MEKMEKAIFWSKTGMIRKLLFKINHRDLLLKLLSLCLGAMLWYLVVGADKVDMNLKIPIEILNLPENLVISNLSKNELDVTIRGPRSIINSVRKRNISRSVDLSKAEAGTTVIKNNSESLNLPRGITVLQLQPSNITLSIDRLIQKQIPINAVTEGEVSAGYKLLQITLTPDSLAVSGPESILDSAMALTTYVINLDGLDKSTTLPVHLNLSAEFDDLIGETTVSADIRVGEKLVNKTIKRIPINVKDATVPVKVEPDTITVVADIPENLIRDTPEPAMLFRASVNAREVRLTRKVAVTVTPVAVPGHAKIIIKSQEPLEVSLSPTKDLEKAKKEAEGGGQKKK